MLARVTYGGRAADILRICAKVLAYAVKPSQEICHVAAHHAPVIVALIHHDVLKIRKKAGPEMLPGKEAVVDHLRISQNYLRAAIPHDPFLPIAHRANVAGYSYAYAKTQCGSELVKSGKLVVYKSVRRSDIEGRSLRIRQDLLEYGDHVSQRLSTCCTRNNYDILAAADSFDGGSWCE